MGSKEWREAAETIEARKRQPEVEAAEIQAEARKLESFLSGVEGEAAKRLLTATAKHIILGELPASPGRAFICFLDGQGLRQSIEGAGLSGAYENKKPDVSATTPELAAKAFKGFVPVYGRPKPADIISHIHGELDKIVEGLKKD
jgi:hypothetical protein